MLEIRGVDKRYGRRSVLRGLDLAVEPAEHVALIGNNGQGKTTLLRLVVGLLRPDGGAIRIGGERMGFPRAPAHKRLVGYLPESVTFYPHLTGGQTLRFLGRLKGVGPAPALEREVARLLGRVRLTAFADERVERYSKGMRQRLGLAQALLGAPRLLLLDEPTNGLDPEGVHEFYDLLSGLQRDGVAILMASHLLAEIEPRLDRLAVLRNGGIEKLGTVAQLAAEARLPVTIRFSLRGEGESLPEELAALSPRAVSNGAVRTWQLSVAGASKFQVLERLVRHAERMESLVVREPGLEELFRHLNAPARGAAPEKEGS